jgi:hypothetical protein
MPGYCTGATSTMHRHDPNYDCFELIPVPLLCQDESWGYDVSEIRSRSRPSEFDATAISAVESDPFLLTKPKDMSEI